MSGATSPPSMYPHAPGEPVTPDAVCSELGGERSRGAGEGVAVPDVSPVDVDWAVGYCGC